MKSNHEKHDRAIERAAKRWIASEMRRIETWGRRIATGMAVLNEQSDCRKRAVAKVATKIGKSERHVWGTVRLGAKMQPIVLAALEEEARKKRSRPGSVAGLFLLKELQQGPRLAKEIEHKAREAGIAARTLRRQCKRLRVKKRHHGGRHGYWTWELSTDIKQMFGFEV